MEKKPNIVVLGGGTGLSVLLRGLKNFPVNITAVVTVADDGGSTGRLREEFNIPALGDIRNVIVSLSEVEPLVEDLLQYRFKTSSDLGGHPTGNLLLTAMVDITGNIVDAIEGLSSVLNIKGKILPATEENVTLVGVFKDGTYVEGESKITAANKVIDKVKYKEEPTPVPEVIEAINEADLIVFGIGSLYTSVIPNILPTKTKKAIIESNAKKIYICNAMTEKGETENYKASDYVEALSKHLKDYILDAIIVNDLDIPSHIRTYYDKENAVPVEIDDKNLSKYGLDIIRGRLVVFKDNVVRHNSNKLASVIYSYIID